MRIIAPYLTPDSGLHRAVWSLSDDLCSMRQGPGSPPA